MRVDLAEGCETLAMRCLERIGIDSTRGYERSSHIPVPCGTLRFFGHSPL